MACQGIHLNPPIASALGGNALLHSNAPRTPMAFKANFGAARYRFISLHRLHQTGMVDWETLKSDYRLRTRRTFSEGIYLQLTELEDISTPIKAQSKI